MIRKQELRIGNKVIYKPYGNKDGELVTIEGMLGMSAYFSKYSNEHGMFHNLEPISLTPEILRKAGFIKIQEGDMARPEVWRIEYTPVLVKNRLDLQNRDPGEYRWIEGNTNVELLYLHELQNLFYVLSGQELTISNL